MLFISTAFLLFFDCLAQYGGAPYYPGGNQYGPGMNGPMNQCGYPNGGNYPYRQRPGPNYQNPYQQQQQQQPGYFCPQRQYPQNCCPPQQQPQQCPPTPMNPSPQIPQQQAPPPAPAPAPAPVPPPPAPPAPSSQSSPQPPPPPPSPPQPSPPPPQSSDQSVPVQDSHCESNPHAQTQQTSQEQPQYCGPRPRTLKSRGGTPEMLNELTPSQQRQAFRDFLKQTEQV
ncbi:uncharacterized protein MONOS_15326 [Monocercomonoides exilis]|uniref:uncharacterized protein n=1 Tax=Monocercomonoides exilis TaxID=2049356 RepID=UPI00355AADF0|nr:hypothetical protein MONOS_15326 [Monocercomonoides exilis]|eukprot:MONOS_15326.1-p1 / transcript=MONOS_15326.1 / gene=MONOS_15326 / organism=Monocercomonoides_exilis_PA203 / gene_product=unspecified product / transcript_product=unspecified product / location=Mono_scaffold01198:9084-9954(-) / protein_length=227 / sequence_SO=supercontig / SO=protein_coding / is_pseudo=false